MSDSTQQYDLKVDQIVAVRITGQNLVEAGDGGPKTIEALIAEKFQQMLISAVEVIRTIDDDVAVVVTDLRSEATLREVAA